MTILGTLKYFDLSIYIPPPLLHKLIMANYSKDVKLVTPFPNTSLEATILLITIMVVIVIFCIVWFKLSIPKNEKFGYSLLISNITAILISLELHFLG